jgi:hypothetical protein
MMHSIASRPSAERQIIAELDCGDLRDMLMLRDGKDLVLGQPGQGDTIFER